MRNRVLSHLLVGSLLLLVGVTAPGQDTKNPSDQPAPLPGCETKEVKSGGKGAQERFFAAPLPKVKEALTSALASLEFEVKKDKDNVIEAHKRRHVGVFVGSGGEKVVLHLKEAEEGGTKGTEVTGETVKNMLGRMGQKTWTGAVLDQASCTLENGSK